MTIFSYGDGRVWLQKRKFQPFELLLPYGITGVTDPSGALTAVREPSATTRRKSVISEILRGEAALPEFQIETRLRKTLNYMFGLDCAVNFQAHLGACDRADNYYASEIAVHWQRALHGDRAIDRLAKIEGDDSPIQVTVPFSAEVGPIIIDFMTEFLSARTVLETEAFSGIAFLSSECLEDCQSQESAGENGYAVTEAKAGSPVNVANVWYTGDSGQTWTETSQRPFAGGEDIIGPVLAGIKSKHRIIIGRGTADAGNPAEIAYADVTTLGTTVWVRVNVGAINGQYIKALYWLDYMHLYASTNDGYVYKSADGGATWTTALTTAVNALNAIAALGYGSYAGQVWVVGASNTIYKSTDYGVTWTAITGPVAAQIINTVCLTTDGTVFVGYANGALYGSMDGGSSWSSLPVQGITATSIAAIQAWGDFVIWAAANTADGGYVVRSTDGGATFQLWHLNMPVNSGINCLAVVDPNIVYAAGEPQGGYGFITKTASQVLGV